MTPLVVSDLPSLLAAFRDPSSNDVVVDGSIADVPTLRLPPGRSLVGRGSTAELLFADDVDGLQLTTDNRVESLGLRTSPERRAVHNDADVATLGRLELRSVRTVGQVQIVAGDGVRGGHVEIDGLDVVAADVRDRAERPQGYGVHVLQGAVTIWNTQPEEAVTITARLDDVRVGRPGAPVRGGGVFVGGAGDRGGRLHASRVRTGPIHSDGGIAPGTPDVISGGMFVVYGAFVDEIVNAGPVTTYGPNDMVLDNWGTVDRWTAEDKITSFGPSGIGFVNFGTIDTLSVGAPIETFGQGARGFNVYTGTVRVAVFDRVVTHADGAVGIQISRPVGRIEVRRGIETHGGIGESLVKGVVIRLAAIAFSVKPGGSVAALAVEGGLVTHGPAVEPLELHGAIESLSIGGGFSAAGGGFAGI